ncbi:MAG: hypothetical protein MUF00_17135 [Gemmatimonadaceae bacterium]|nr:hypothetical protein [Gemmatimonadaceae bacterium]
MTGNTHQITPFMHVADFERALRFLTETLGFTAFFNDGGYAYLEREGAGLRLLQNSDPAELGVPHGGFAYYIDVRDQPYGQRELMIRAPDGNLIVFGASIEP